jgi:hypothetical protein
MYVGKTPERRADVVGERLPRNATRHEYEARLAASQRERRGTAVYPAEERCSREEMRERDGQPRILLTNVKQLELLLTRQSDIQMFDQARLEFLVLDEAHTYGGALGAETACLIRRLRAFCGRTVQETVCVATSATLADPEGGQQAARSFASRFFGVPPDHVELIGEEYARDEWKTTRAVPPAPPDAGRALHDVLRSVDGGEAGDQSLARAYTSLSGSWLGAGDVPAALYDALAGNELVFQLADVLTHPRFLGDVVRELSGRAGRQVREEEVLTSSNTRQKCLRSKRAAAGVA